MYSVKASRGEDVGEACYPLEADVRFLLNGLNPRWHSVQQVSPPSPRHPRRALSFASSSKLYLEATLTFLPAPPPPPHWYLCLVLFSVRTPARLLVSSPATLMGCCCYGNAGRTCSRSTMRNAMARKVFLSLSSSLSRSLHPFRTFTCVRKPTCFTWMGDGRARIRKRGERQRKPRTRKRLMTNNIKSHQLHTLHEPLDVSVIYSIARRWNLNANAAACVEPSRCCDQWKCKSRLSSVYRCHFRGGAYWQWVVKMGLAGVCQLQQLILWLLCNSRGHRGRRGSWFSGKPFYFITSSLRFDSITQPVLSYATQLLSAAHMALCSVVVWRFGLSLHICTVSDTRVLLSAAVAHFSMLRHRSPGGTKSERGKSFHLTTNSSILKVFTASNKWENQFLEFKNS